MGRRVKNSEFIEKLRVIHGDKYDLSCVEYVNAKTKIKVGCYKHGYFEILPSVFLKGCECPKCKGRGLSNEEIIGRFKEVHGNKYDYSKVVFSKMHEKVCVICPEHGEFWITPSKHYSKKQGCPKCAIKRRVEKQYSNEKDVIEKFIKTHSNKYDYSKVRYVSMRDKVEIVCPAHGSFFQYPFDHINGHGCPKCGFLISNAEDEIYKYICKSIDKNEVVRHDRNILNGKEIDIIIPKLKIGIEYNGLKWHSDEFKDKKYHLDKLNVANSKGIKLIQIFEDEYNEKKEIVLSKISHLLGLYKNKAHIMARKCVVRGLDKVQARMFLNKNHIQGYGKCSFSYGCFYNEKLIGVMSFTEYDNNKYELIRFATDINFICNGVGGKLFKYFLKKHNPIEVKTFADRRWTINRECNFYTKIGFIEDKILEPDYKYVNTSDPQTRIHKFNFRKKTINKKYNLPLKLSENEMIKEIGYSKIYDCGLIRYVWKK